MTNFNQNINSILVISLHGYVAAEPELGKPDTGGQVVFVLELAKRFSRLGMKVDLLTRKFEDQPDEDAVNDNLRVWRVPFGGKKFIRKEDMHDYLGDFVTNTLTQIRKLGTRYDIVYSHYWDAGYAGQKIADELQIPHVHIPHSLGWWKQNNMGVDMEEADMEKKYRFKERIRKEFLMYQMCDHLIATTEQQSELMMEHYDILDSRITVIPPGMDEDRYSPVRSEDQQKLRKKLGFKKHDVLTLGRMAHNKGYDLLIQAMPTMLEIIPDARLIAAIGGEEKGQDKKGVEDLKKLAKELGVEDKIEWRSYIPDDELANYYRSATVFAMPSRYEPFGMVAIEAMACGTPAVVTIHGGLFESITFGHNALCADPNQPVEFGAMLAYALKYPILAHRLSVEGARFARRNFGWTGIAKKTLHIFSSIKQQQWNML